MQRLVSSVVSIHICIVGKGSIALFSSLSRHIRRTYALIQTGRHNIHGNKWTQALLNHLRNKLNALTIIWLPDLERRHSTPQKWVLCNISCTLMLDFIPWHLPLTGILSPFDLPQDGKNEPSWTISRSTVAPGPRLPKICMYKTV